MFISLKQNHCLKNYGLAVLIILFFSSFSHPFDMHGDHQSIEDKAKVIEARESAERLRLKEEKERTEIQEKQRTEEKARRELEEKRIREERAAWQEHKKQQEKIEQKNMDRQTKDCSKPFKKR